MELAIGRLFYIKLVCVGCVFLDRFDAALAVCLAGIGLAVQYLLTIAGKQAEVKFFIFTFKNLKFWIVRN